MSKMKIYSAPGSRASRVMWCAREASAPFELVEFPWDQLKSPDFLAINPNGKVPAFAEPGMKLFESLAINIYIAKKYSLGKLYPTDPIEEAQVLQWSFWAVAEIEPNSMPALLFAIGFSTDEAAAKAGIPKLKAPLTVLNDHLKNRQWLVGDNFTVADLNVSSVVGTIRVGKIDISYAPHVEAWLDRCFARAARNPDSVE